MLFFPRALLVCSRFLSSFRAVSCCILSLLFMKNSAAFCSSEFGLTAGDDVRAQGGSGPRPFLNSHGFVQRWRGASFRLDRHSSVRLRSSPCAAAAPPIQQTWIQSLPRHRPSRVSDLQSARISRSVCPSRKERQSRILACSNAAGARNRDPFGRGSANDSDDRISFRSTVRCVSCTVLTAALTCVYAAVTCRAARAVCIGQQGLRRLISFLPQFVHFNTVQPFKKCFEHLRNRNDGACCFEPTYPLC